MTDPEDTGDEREALLRTSPEASAYYAVAEMQQGRLEWLAAHIRLCDFQIHPIVAKKILAMIEGSEPGVMFELKGVRRTDLPPAKKDAWSIGVRDFEWACIIARKCRFKRGRIAKACEDIAEKDGFEISYIMRRARAYQEKAMAVVAEEDAAAHYRAGELDFLSRPIYPRKAFGKKGKRA